MRYLSICSGIEAASVAWHGLGWEPVAFSEIEPFPSAVLAHHYPSVPNLGDMTTLPERILSRELEAPDLLVGGPPCQAFSVAGLRRGLDDARGSLTLTYCEIANAIDHVRLADGRDPAIIIYENVPGLLSSKDNAFGCLLAGLAGESEALQAPRGKWRDAGVVVGPQRLAVWRVLNAEFFGLAQRRRRIFLISVALRHPRAWAIAESIFPLSACLSWNPPARGEARQVSASGATPSVAGSLDTECGGGKLTHQSAANGHVIAQPSWWDGADVAATLTRQNAAGGQRMPDKDNLGAVLQPVAQPVATFAKTHKPMSATDAEGWSPVDAAPTVTHWPRDRSDGGTDVAVVYERHDQDARVKEVSVAPTLHSKSDNTCDLPMVMQPVGTDCYNGAITGDVAATIGTPGSSVNASGPTVMQTVAFSRNDDGGDATEDCAPTMRVAGRAGGMLGVAQSVGSFKPGQSAAARSIGYETEIAPSLEGGGGGNNKPAVHVAMQVRRLTPTECERLQGFPDGYTNIPWRKKPEAPDGPRYKALGNSMAVPCMKWIGERIQAATARQEVKP